MPTQPASHAPCRLRPKEVRPRSRVSGPAPKLKLLSSSESRLRIESDTGDVVSLFCSRAQGGLSRSATGRVVSAAPQSAPRDGIALVPGLADLPQGSNRTLALVRSPSVGHPPAAAKEEQPVASSGEGAGVRRRVSRSQRRLRASGRCKVGYPLYRSSPSTGSPTPLPT